MQINRIQTVQNKFICSFHYRFIGMFMKIAFIYKKETCNQFSFTFSNYMLLQKILNAGINKD